MVLKIFVKRKAHGELCSTQFEWSDTLNQGVEILKKETANGFEFYINRADGTANQVYCPTATHGYEILNDFGAVIERYVTAVDEKAVRLNLDFIEDYAVAFGLYLLSDERMQKISEINRLRVTDADVENFKEIWRNKKEVVL